MSGVDQDFIHVKETLQSNDTDSSNSDWEEENQIEDLIPAKCLFCSETFRNCDEAFDHGKQHHGFDLKKLKSQLNLNCFSYIRLVNFLRKQHLLQMVEVENEDLINALSDDTYMKPVDETDVLLMFDIEDVDCTTNSDNEDSAKCCKESEDYQILKKRMVANEAKLKETVDQLQTMRQQIIQMKEFLVEVLEDNHFSKKSNGNSSDDIGYFQSYAHFSIHQEMLQDEVRTISYRNAILDNQELFKNKIVLDVGCGTGILSMFAALAGASTIIGVDESEIAYQAMDIVNENNLQNRITIVKGKMESVNLPKSPVDIIVSEWMGYFLLFESMLETVIYARDKYLTEGGYMLPNSCNILIAGVCDLDQHRKMISFWDDVYGFKMTCLKSDVIREAAVAKVDGNKLITEPCIVHNLDLMTCTSACLSFTSCFQFTITRDEPLTAVTAWFDTYFNLPNKVYFSTSPNDPTTHWKQTLFYLRQPLVYPKGSVVDGKICCTKPGFGSRLLTIELTIGDYKEEYMLQ